MTNKHGKHKRPRAKLRVEKDAKKRRQNRRRMTEEEFLALPARKRWRLVAERLGLLEPPAVDG